MKGIHIAISTMSSGEEAWFYMTQNYYLKTIESTNTQSAKSSASKLGLDVEIEPEHL